MKETLYCGFEKKKPCTNECIYYATCARNPHKEEKREAAVPEWKNHIMKRFL